MEAKRRALQSVVVGTLAGVLFVLIITFLPPCATRGCGIARGRLLAGTFVALVSAAGWMWATKGKIAVENDGLIINRHLVRWDAIRTMAWDLDRAGGVLRPRIQLGIEEIGDDRRPRRVVLTVTKRDLLGRMSLTSLWQTVQERANPENVHLVTDPPDPTSDAPSVDASSTE